MKASTQCNLLYVVGGIFVFLGSFLTTLGLPDWVMAPCYLIFVVCAWSVVWLQRRAKKRRDPTFIPPTPAQYRRHTWLLLAVAFVSCVASPFALPYSSISFLQLVVVAVITFALCAALIIMVRGRREET